MARTGTRESDEAPGRSGECLMEHLVQFPTRLKSNILDLIITNILEKVVDATEEERLGKSDYMVIVMKIVVGVCSEEDKIPTPDWRITDAMRENLRDTTWRDGLVRMTIEMAWKTCTVR
jgi:hypothetical protein